MQVHETARQVANVPVSANPVPYDQMKSQCEALVMEKQQKMSVLLSFKHSRADSHGSTRVDGLEMNEACISSKYSHHTYHSFRFQICFFSREENAVQILTSLSSIVMCCSHPCDQSLRCNQLGRGACAAAIHYPANLTVRSGCHLQAHTTSSWKRLDGSLARLREAWRFTSVYKRVYKIFMPFPAPCSYSPFWEFSFKCTLTFLDKVYKFLLLLETRNKRKCIGNRTSSCIIQYYSICSFVHGERNKFYPNSCVIPFRLLHWLQYPRRPCILHTRCSL